MSNLSRSSDEISREVHFLELMNDIVSMEDVPVDRRLSVLLSLMRERLVELLFEGMDIDETEH